MSVGHVTEAKRHLVNELVGDDASHPLLVERGRLLGIVQQVGLSVGDEAPVLHGTGAKVRDGDLVWDGNNMRFIHLLGNTLWKWAMDQDCVEPTQLGDGVVHGEIFFKVVENDLGYFCCVIRRVFLTGLGVDPQL